MKKETKKMKYITSGNISFPNLLSEVTVMGKDLRRIPTPKPKYDKRYLDWFLRKPINNNLINQIDSLNKINFVPKIQGGGNVPDFEAIFKGVKKYRDFTRSLDSTLNVQLKNRWLSGEKNFGVKWVGQAPINPIDTMSNSTLSGFNNFLNQKLDSVIRNSPPRYIERKEPIKYKPLKEFLNNK